MTATLISYYTTTDRENHYKFVNAKLTFRNVFVDSRLQVVKRRLIPHHLITDGSTAHGGQVNNDGCLLSGLPQTETENFSVGLWLVFCTHFAAEPGVLCFEKSKIGGLFL